VATGEYQIWLLWRLLGLRRVWVITFEHRIEGATIRDAFDIERRRVVSDLEPVLDPPRPERTPFIVATFIAR